MRKSHYEISRNMRQLVKISLSGSQGRVRTAQGKLEEPGERDFLEKVRENLKNLGNSLTIFTASWKTQGILFCQTSLIK